MGQGAHKVWVVIDGERLLVEVENLSQRPVIAHVEGSRFEIELDAAGSTAGSEETPLEVEEHIHSIPAGTSCDVTAPMPGDITAIHVRAGQVVGPGDALCVLDAMKMKNTIHAPQAGTIAEVCVTEGQSVEYGVILFKFG